MESDLLFSFAARETSLASRIHSWEELSEPLQASVFEVCAIRLRNLFKHWATHFWCHNTL